MIAGRACERDQVEVDEWKRKDGRMCCLQLNTTTLANNNIPLSINIWHIRFSSSIIYLYVMPQLLKAFGKLCKRSSSTAQHEDSWNGGWGTRKITQSSPYALSHVFHAHSFTSSWKIASPQSDPVFFLVNNHNRITDLSKHWLLPLPLLLQPHNVLLHFFPFDYC